MELAHLTQQIYAAPGIAGTVQHVVFLTTLHIPVNRQSETIFDSPFSLSCSSPFRCPKRLQTAVVGFKILDFAACAASLCIRFCAIHHLSTMDLR